MMSKALYHLALSVLLLSCKKKEVAATELFDSIPSAVAVNPIINETSGIADSKTHPGFLWAHEDSGTPAQLYLVKHDGTVVKKVFIKNAVNRDWEDMVLANNEIYIGDIGDNNAIYPSYTIYKFAEPSANTDTVHTVEAISFQYADGPHDAEAFLVDPVSKHIYIITKRTNPSKIYKISFPYSGAMNTAVPVGALAYGGVVSAAMSNNGKEIIVKTYQSLFYYTRANDETIEQALQKTYKSLSYQIEPQGEAVAFATNGSGFFTLSEKGFASSVNLYFYRRK